MAETTEAGHGIEMSGPVTYSRAYTDDHGETHFSDEVLTFQLVDYAPPAPPISVSNVFEAENVGFISSPPGWHGDWHPAPRRQFILVLVGELEVKVSDGEMRRLGPGDLCLVSCGRGACAGGGHPALG
jgi:quercetin dioxygenase-like cupin family protein